MASIDKNKTKYKNWFSEYSTGSCKLNRGSYGQFILEYISNEKNGFVLNLNGSWGTGKTNFVRRLYIEALNKGHPAIYIDAWESDFTKEPLAVVASELTSQLTALNSDIGSNMDNLKEGIGRVLKTTAIVTAGIISKKFMDDSTVGMEAAKSLIDRNSSISHINFISSSYQEQIKSIKKIREELSCLAEVLKTNFSSKIPVVVIIDELDRCRPDYAIEMLEVIKHFFQTNNFVFVIATDTEQLQNSIQAIYGHNFDSRRYLKRFFDREAKLPEPDIKLYLVARNFMLDDYTENISYSPSIINGANILDFLSTLFEEYGQDIRDIDQILNKAISCLRQINSHESTDKPYIDIILLFIAIIENHINKEEYFTRTNTDYKIYNVSESKIEVNKISASNMLTCAVKFTAEYDRRNNARPNTVSRTRVWHQDFQHSHDNDHSRNTYINAYKQDISMVENEKNFWRWEQYRKLVDLAGNIE
ncbi:MAG: KAP family P-loop NTPase fold protein [Pseudomonadales bacterium]